MRNWLICIAVLIVGILFWLGTRAEEVDANFAIDKASRMRWIDGEIMDLQLERLCVFRAKNRVDMRRCNR